MMADLLKDKKKLIVILGMVGIVLIFISTIFDGEETETEVIVEEVFCLDDYVTNLEEKLSAIVSAITGESSPCVMITAVSSGEKVFAYDSYVSSSDSSTTEEDTYVIVNQDDGSDTLVEITELEPEIKGVVVVSEFADNIIIKEKILNAVTTTFGLSTNQVCVVSKNSN